jgi:hypothetical protein
MRPDPPSLPDVPSLPAQIARDEDVTSRTAAAAFDTRKCHVGIAERAPAAAIPPRKNGQGLKGEDGS